MKYVSIDLETTGLDPNYHQVLQVALVLEDTARPEVPVEHLPYFECLVSYETAIGSPFALALNAEVLKAIGSPRREGPDHTYATLRGRDIALYPKSEWESVATDWLSGHLGSNAIKKKVTACGKNAAGFRVLDPGSLFADFTKERLPSLGDLKQRFGLGDQVSHDALEDARDVIRVIRAGCANQQRTHWITPADDLAIAKMTGVVP